MSAGPAGARAVPTAAGMQDANTVMSGKRIYVHFRVPFFTKWGQSLILVGSGEWLCGALGGFDLILKRGWGVRVGGACARWTLEQPDHIASRPQPTPCKVSQCISMRAHRLPGAPVVLGGCHGSMHSPLCAPAAVLAWCTGTQPSKCCEPASTTVQRQWFLHGPASSPLPSCSALHMWGWSVHLCSMVGFAGLWTTCLATHTKRADYTPWGRVLREWLSAWVRRPCGPPPQVVMIPLVGHP